MHAAGDRKAASPRKFNYVRKIFDQDFCKTFSLDVGKWGLYTSQNLGRLEVKESKIVCQCGFPLFDGLVIISAVRQVCVNPRISGSQVHPQNPDFFLDTPVAKTC